jgi:hypothetical protein
MKKRDAKVIQFQKGPLVENTFKIIISILMFITIFTPPVHTKTIYFWEFIFPPSYFRAIVFIIGCAYLPGAAIYNIFFSKSALQERFKVESFFFKISVYPLMSFSFIGVTILIFDQLRFTMEIIMFLLFALILCLTVIDLILQNKRNTFIRGKEKSIRISKHTLIILILAFGIATISIGFQIGWKYLVSGDPWDAIKYANYIADPVNDPIFLSYKYPNFWGYIIYGLSSMSGLPFININTFLAPFSYLFITSSYLFVKSILINSNPKYAVLATFLMATFSGIFTNPLVPSLIFVGEFYFIYKSYSYCLFFIGMALFLILINRKSNQINDLKTRKFWQSEDFKILSLSSLFFLLCFMTYIFPLFIGVIFLLLFCLFSKRERIYFNFSYFLHLSYLIILFFLIFDIILQFYLSHIIVFFFLVFFNIEFLTVMIQAISPPILTYSLFFVALILLYLLKRFVFSNNRRIKVKLLSSKLNSFRIFKIFLLLFASLLVIEIVYHITEIVVIDFNLSIKLFFFLYLDKIFLSLGFIGTLGVLLSIYIIKRHKRLFLILLSWIILTFLFASLLIYIEWMLNLGIIPDSYFEENPVLIWFDRIWIYSIPPLCIFASIGFFELGRKLKETKYIKERKTFQSSLKVLSFISLIFFSFSGVIITGLNYGNANYRYSETRIETLGWISENIPLHAGILVMDNFFMGVGIDSITFVRQYFLNDIFDEKYNESTYLQQYNDLKIRNVQYAHISEQYLSLLPRVENFTYSFLIPNFYNYTVYSLGDLTVYYAPFFN